MDDKEKHIGEMAKDLERIRNEVHEKTLKRPSGYIKNSEYNSKENCLRFELATIFELEATKLYEQGYRKIPKDSVVLPRETYELYEHHRNNYEVGKRDGCKETAEKIITDLWDNKFETTITIQNNCSKEDIENVGKAIITTIRNKLEELAKQFGVEIEE